MVLKQPEITKRGPALVLAVTLVFLVWSPCFHKFYWKIKAERYTAHKDRWIFAGRSHYAVQIIGLVMSELVHWILLVTYGM